MFVRMFTFCVMSKAYSQLIKLSSGHVANKTKLLLINVFFLPIESALRKIINNNSKDQIQKNDVQHKEKEQIKKHAKQPIGN